MPSEHVAERDRITKKYNTLRVENDFIYHAPKPGQADRYESIRAKAKEFALFILDTVPCGREQSLALTNLDQVVFWANAAIARNE